MRPLIVAIMLSLLPGAASAGDVFGNWMIFPGPNPDASDLLPYADPATVFRVGQIIFDYPFDRLAKDEHPVNDFSKLPSIADIVKAATPGPALVALVDQQLITPHTFCFESASVVGRGDGGFMWYVTYALFPKEGGVGGRPFQYRAALDGRGKLVLPRMTVFDAFLHSPEEGWTCSTLQVPTSPTAADATLSREKIRSSATKSLLNATGPADAGETARSRMQYQSQEIVRIPIATDPTGRLIHAEIWAVNFRDPSRTAGTNDLFTVWVTADGRAADIQQLDFLLR